MGTSFAFTRYSLPLRDKGVIEKHIDWIAVWEKWAVQDSAVLLESAGDEGEAADWLILAGDPEEEFFEENGKSWIADATGLRQVATSFLDFMDEIGRNESNFSVLPFCLGMAWFGAVSYEFGKKIHLKPGRYKSISEKISVPDFYFFKPRRVLAFNRRSKEYFRFEKDFIQDDWIPERNRDAFRVNAVQAQWTWADYEAVVKRAKSYIANGDVYQTNLAQSFQAKWNGNPGSLYQVLREINPAPFMGIFKGRNFIIVSSSPERLVAGKGDWLETRPIAGTRPRGKDCVQDLQLQVELKRNQKEQAEHLMLVDLARNDLGKVASYGTVEVKRYAQVESYAKVHHLVSVVQAGRRRDVTMKDVFCSLFPGGTITGCPKIRCMEIIDELETMPRGFYTGSMGYVAPGPSFDFNILIRSFTLFSDGTLDFKAGSGIVADSDPRREYMETLYKVEALAQALGTSFLPQS